MTSKSFKIDWYPHAALYDWSKLEAEEIALLAQIVNSIYIENQPIENDPEHLSRLIKGFTVRKVKKVLQQLAEKGAINFDNNGKITQKRCKVQLNFVQTLRKQQSNGGQKSAEIRRQNKENQTLNSKTLKNSEASSNSNSNSKKEKEEKESPKNSPQTDKSISDKSPICFEGNVVRLNNDDFEKMARVWSGICDDQKITEKIEIDFREYLANRDKWLATQPAGKRNQWFVSTWQDIRRLTRRHANG